MSDRFEHIARCLDLQEQDIADAAPARDATRALLSRLAEVSAPNTGAAKALLVFARMATNACDWIDGDLAIELAADGDRTRIDASTELGGGLRERLFPPVTLHAPIEEFARAIDRVPRMIAPLGIRARTASAISLSVSAAVRRTSAPPAAIEIATDSLFVRVPAAAVPREAAPVPLPVVTTGLPVVGDAGSPRPDAPGTQSSEPPAAAIDGGWDE
jgi:hypothetical protein